nr:hypothetical protein [Bacillus sp. FJAT-45350]
MFTIRKPFSEGLYFDAGAFRISTNHKLVGEYIKKHKLKTHPFISTTLNDVIYVNGYKTSRFFYEQNPDSLGYRLDSHEQGKTINELIEELLTPFLSSMTV